MGFISFGWGKNKTPPVEVQKDLAGNTTYKLTNLDSKFTSCIKDGYSTQNMLTLFMTIPEVFSPIDIIASRVQNGIFQLKRLKDDEIVYDNKRWNKFIERPNWSMNFSRFIYQSVVSDIVAGNLYYFKNIPLNFKDKFENIDSVWILPPQYTEPHIKSIRPKIYRTTTSTDMVDYYIVDWDGTENIPADFVLHDATLDLGSEISNSFKGLSILRAAVMPMSNLIAVYEARNVIYVKRGALGAIVNRKEDASGSVALSSKEKQGLRDDVNNTYGVTGGRDLYGVTDIPIDFVRFGMSIEELQPFDETYASAAALYGVLSVPRSFIPTKDGPTYTNGPADDRKLYQDVCIKKGMHIANLLTTLLNLEAEGLYIHVSYDHISVLQDDKAAAASTKKMNVETYKLLYEANMITKNQFLIGIGEEAVPNGDTYVSDAKNNDPLALKLQVGTLQSLEAIVTSAMPKDVKINYLIGVFGIDPALAAKLSVDDNQGNETTGKDKGAEEIKPASV